MSNELIKAADDARRLLRGFQAFAEVGQALELAGTAVQAKNEAERSLIDLRKQIEVAQADLLTANSAATKANEEAKRLLDNAEIAAKNTTDAAIADAAALNKAAERSARDVADKAGRAVKAAEESAAKADASRAQAESELAEIEKKIEAARAKIAKMLG